ncbi:MAG: threonine ammonia-lyase [Bdellovibrionales bacterium]|nr:threonine ammonia-lyase [Bdellovibrionales bacterium]
MSARPNLDEITRAHARIQSHISLTPLRLWDYLRRTMNFTAPMYLKLDNFQNTGSFKVRGGANKILKLLESGQKPPCLVAASAGNHAQAVAYVGGKLGIPAKIVMPEGTPIVKAAATADYGAQVILHGIVYDEAYAKAQEILKATPGAVYVHAYEDPDIIAGQGTMGIEIHEQLKAAGVTTDDIQVIVPIGGGGMISGVAIALKALRPRCTIFGVVSQAAPAMAESLKVGHVMPPPVGGKRTLAEGLAVKKVSEMTFAIIKDLVKEIAIIDEDEVAVAIATLMERGKLVAEGAGAAGVAAVLARKLKLDPAKPTVVVLCGGNIDMNLVSNILERGLSRDERWLNLAVTVEDKPGELARLTSKVAEMRANVLEVSHDRTSTRCPVGHTRIELKLETRGKAHAQELREALRNNGYKLEGSNA